MNHFSYAERLHEFRNPTIRILDILPGRDPSRSIYCRLRHTSLKTKPTYDAISYCWGELSPVAEIICNGRSLNITQNLHDALLVFRSQTHVVSVWADAICINQSDGEEKAQQIPFMWRIYQDARTVRVWLG
ncbi:heterokaryon incompatibility protein-domain-containing protein, partial [Bisporella sp. PMI_857]